MGLTIAIIVIFGISLMILETFVPGMIVGTMGALCVLAGMALVMFAEDFAGWPAWVRGLAAAGILLASTTAVLVWLRFFGVKLWRRGFTLTAEVAGAPVRDDPEPGAEGTALTDLRPLGRADFGGRRREVRCEDGFVKAGSSVRVTGREPGNLIVRLQTTTHEPTLHTA